MSGGVEIQLSISLGGSWRETDANEERANNPLRKKFATSTNDGASG